MGPECVGCWVIVFISIQCVWFVVCVCVCVKANGMCGFCNNEVLQSDLTDPHWVTKCMFDECVCVTKARHR